MKLFTLHDPRIAFKFASFTNSDIGSVVCCVYVTVFNLIYLFLQLSYSILQLARTMSFSISQFTNVQTKRCIYVRFCFEQNWLLLTSFLIWNLSISLGVFKHFSFPPTQTLKLFAVLEVNLNYIRVNIQSLFRISLLYQSEIIHSSRPKNCF